jgi:hypothetical protein
MSRSQLIAHRSPSRRYADLSQVDHHLKRILQRIPTGPTSHAEWVVGKDLSGYVTVMAIV